MAEMVGSSPDIGVLRETLARIGRRADRAAGFFYAKLFLEHPEIRELFPVQMDVQRARLVRAVLRILQGLDEAREDGPEGLERFLDALGRDHRKFGVRPEHYVAVGRCLVAALREYSGSHWTPAVEAVWVDAYELVAGRMVAAASAADADTPPWWDAEIVRVDRRPRDIAVITVRPDPPYPFRAGQYASLSTPYRPGLWRPYSMANAPRDDGTLEFHVRAVPGGWVSSPLVWRGAVGDTLRLGPPTGLLEVDHVSLRDVLFIAGGTGLAPVKALLEDMAGWNRGRGVTVFFGGRDRDHLYDLAALRDLARAHGWLTVVPVTEDDPGFAAEAGTLPEAVTRRGPWLRHDVYVSGSPAMIRATVDALETEGMKPERVHYDDFTDRWSG
ncbi:MAG TPA: globin domain-containing protein [Mycobacteriales bacterium]|jgi:NAD(P)H-flavin reductase/hemoglobin-like flavoprotein